MPEDKKEERQISTPQISLPKGGGAIRGIGEKFAANPVTGTGSMTVPIAVSPGRSGFGPQLSLSYDSGSGNGPFGFGWSLSLPSIARKTDKGLPKYWDDEESDEFILSGAEDLVQVFKKKSNGEWEFDGDGRHVIDEIDCDGYKVRRYRPRIEGLFARIERWTNKSDPTDVSWRSISRDNITTWYGKTENSRIADPGDKTRVFSWLICQSYDDKGNAIVYEYERDNTNGVDTTQAHEKNRTDTTRSANRYLKRIKYGNKISRLIQTDLSQMSWLFEVVFDYDDGHYEELPFDPDTPEAEQHQYVRANIVGTKDEDGRIWAVRQDPFSSYRAGFEVRTYRLCHRVLIFHCFPDELGIDDYLVRSTEFTYDQSPIASFIKSVTQSGYKYDMDKEKYLKKSLPPLEFEYSQAVINEDIQKIDAESIENLPNGLDGSRYQWVDLDGEGLSGILTEQADAWFYKPNRGNGQFGPLTTVAAKPSLASLSSGRQQLLDLAGDGQLDLVQFSDPTPGFYERTNDQHWEQFIPFSQLPNIPWDDPNLRFVDLNGDGHADILITENEVFTWYPSLAEEGFDRAEKVRQALDEEEGPKLIFADGTQSIYLADLSGDGLTDLVRIRNGEVSYWPNLGYGRFGPKVTMDNAPWFDSPDQFDQRRIRTADIDGSGTTDIIYLDRDKINIYRNQCGNSWANPEALKSFPPVDNLSSVMVADLLGNGTACLVWSSPLPGEAHQPMQYIDLMGGQKPHLLVETVNNLGATTHVHYAPSTKFYLADKEAGKPWITRLPFSVHVVEQVVTYDHISRNRFVTRYAYHHGYFDGTEREFRGFGMVEQRDTEEFAVLEADGLLDDATNFDEASHVPPVLTKTWFHTGAYIGRDRISNFFAGLLDEEDVGEYYREPGLDNSQARQLQLADTILPDGLTIEEEREACRALKGLMLRQEVYALDGTDKEPHPYAVTEQNFTIRRLQPKEDNRHGVFFTHSREAINYHYERNPADPRIVHTMTLDVDDYGNVLESASIGYGRRKKITIINEHGNPKEIANPELNKLDPYDQKKQTKALITYTENRFTNAVDSDDDYRIPLICEARTYEITGLPLLTEDKSVYTQEELLDALQNAASIPYEDEPSEGALQKRLIEEIRTLYLKDNLSGALSLGEVESLSLPYKGYKAAFTPGLLSKVYEDKINENLLSDEGKYIFWDDLWWIPSGRSFFSPEPHAPDSTFAKEHFYLPQGTIDPFESVSHISYDPYNLLVVESKDALNNTVSAENSYRTMQPELVTDPNGNRSKVTFDALGMVAGTAVMGKEEETLGDSLAVFEPDLTTDQIDDFFNATDPHDPAPTLLSSATTRIIYDLDRFHLTREANPDDQTQWEPALAATLARETHFYDSDGAQTEIQISFSYSDGLGREIQKKIQAEPENPGGPLRWVGSGWTIFNNKGKPVRQYEPFFDDSHEFRFGKQVGVSPILFYDPLERVVATLHPNHTYEKVVFDPWRQERWDVNDALSEEHPDLDPDVGHYFDLLPENDYLPTWYEQMMSGTSEEQGAAEKAMAHAGTPAIAHLDTLGRAFLTIVDNGLDEEENPQKYETRVVLDIEGNQKEITDPRLNRVMQYSYGMLSNQVFQNSMDAGKRWKLANITGNIIKQWDERDHEVTFVYDELRRPREMHVKGGDGTVPLDNIYEKINYGDFAGMTEIQRDKAKQLNLIGKTKEHYDTAGRVIVKLYDFKGNLKESTRQFLNDYKNTPDWTDGDSEALLEQECFNTEIEYDALNRVIQTKTPDGSITLPAYNDAGLLEKIEITHDGETKPYVKNIDYNEKGQRTLITYGNDVETSYKYDNETFRLIHLKTNRSNDSLLQDLYYTYDPVGNIMQIEDKNIPEHFFNNERIEGVSKYRYDPLYRLIEALGREHIGQVEFGNHDNWNDSTFLKKYSPGDDMAWRNYTRTYEYDEVGNIKKMKHSANGGSWTRNYEYSDNNNRLIKTTVGTNNNNFNYTYYPHHPQHGFMTGMPQLEVMEWNFKDELKAVVKQRREDGGAPQTTYYVYDSDGQRVRKVMENTSEPGETPSKKCERIYVAGIEIYREHSGIHPRLERETLHVMDDTKRIAMIETRNDVDDGSPEKLIRYQLDNHLGSVCMETDDSANARVISYEEYHPYGTTAYQAMNEDIKAAAKRYRYSDKERDEESGLYYYGARYYAVWLGRWMAPDPEGLVDGYNVYLFTYDNPIIFKDRDGTQNDLIVIAPRIGSELSIAGIKPGETSNKINYSEDIVLPFEPLVSIPKRRTTEDIIREVTENKKVIERNNLLKGKPPTEPRPLRTFHKKARAPVERIKEFRTKRKPVVKPFSLEDFELSAKAVAVTLSLSYDTTDYLFPWWTQAAAGGLYAGKKFFLEPEVPPMAIMSDPASVKSSSQTAKSVKKFNPPEMIEYNNPDVKIKGKPHGCPEHKKSSWEDALEGIEQEGITDIEINRSYGGKDIPQRPDVKWMQGEKLDTAIEELSPSDIERNKTNFIIRRNLHAIRKLGKQGEDAALAIMGAEITPDWLRKIIIKGLKK